MIRIVKVHFACTVQHFHTSMILFPSQIAFKKQSTYSSPRINYIPSLQIQHKAAFELPQY